MAKVIRDDGQSVSPGLDDGFHVMERALLGVSRVQALVNLRRLIQLHHVLCGLQVGSLDYDHRDDIITLLFPYDLKGLRPLLGGTEEKCFSDDVSIPVIY